MAIVVFTSFNTGIGDNIHTAMHIARECGILTDDDHIALEGPVFRKMFEVRVYICSGCWC